MSATILADFVVWQHYRVAIGPRAIDSGRNYAIDMHMLGEFRLWCGEVWLREKISWRRKNLQ